LPGRAPQGPRLCDQQDAEAVQGPSGLIFPDVPDGRAAHWAALSFWPQPFGNAAFTFGFRAD
jgi:hypothetical protein